MRDGEWKTLPARELVPGDLIKVNQGDIIAADGKVKDRKKQKEEKSRVKQKA